MSELVLVDVAERLATVTLNRLTGADPAFRAGLDLKELAPSGGDLATDDDRDDSSTVTAGDAWDHETERFLVFRRRALDPARVRDPRQR